MALLQIAEPGQSTAPHQHRIAVGIDLGTTHSLVATVRSGKAVVLADEHGQLLLPSVVHYGEQHSTVGQAARNNSEKDPSNTIVSVKRFMGRSLDDIRFEHPLYTDWRKKPDAQFCDCARSQNPGRNLRRHSAPLKTACGSQLD